MGVTGLLPFVKDACVEQVHLSDLSNTVAVIDTYCWLHRALVGSAYAVYQGKPTTAHVDFCLRKVEEMKKYNIRPIFVFDGRNLPAKADVENVRRANRQKAKDEIDKLFQKGDTKTAYKILPRAIDISQEMAKQLIDKLIEEKIDYIVAPYEADAQISYLVRNGFAHFAISEDSDLILYGCDYVLYKLSAENTGTLFRMDKMLDCLGDDAYKFDFCKFRRMCILSGCDYLANLTGIGLKKSKTFFSKMTNNDTIERDLEKLPTVLNMKKLTVPNEYIKKFCEAENVFNHQLVFCPKTKKLRPFTDYSENHVKEKLTYAGEYFDENLAINLAIGNVCFKTMEMFDNAYLDKIEEKFFKSTKSIWNEAYTLEEPDRFETIIQKQLKPCYEMPDELALPSKRKFVDENEMTKIKEKKAKTSPSVSDSMTITLDDQEKSIVCESSFKSTASVQDTTDLTESETSVKVEVKSRFFAHSQEETSPSDLERINQKKQEIRENLKKLYVTKASSEGSTQDSGIYSSGSQIEETASQ